jgi:hypothetical protein
MKEDKLIYHSDDTMAVHMIIRFHGHRGNVATWQPTNGLTFGCFLIDIGRTMSTNY